MLHLDNRCSAGVVLLGRSLDNADWFGELVRDLCGEAAAEAGEGNSEEVGKAVLK